MIEIRIPKEIKDYKERLFFNLTLRQTICTVLAFAVNVPLYIFGKNFIPEDILSWIIIIVAVPIFFAGYFKYNEMHFEEFVKVLFKFNFVNPQKRTFNIKNLYEELEKQNSRKDVDK